MKPRSIVLILRGLFGNSSILSNIFAFLSQKFELSSIRDGSTLVVGSLHLKLVHSLAGIGDHDLVAAAVIIVIAGHNSSLLFHSLFLFSLDGTSAHIFTRFRRSIQVSAFLFLLTQRIQKIKRAGRAVLHVFRYFKP